MLFERLKQLLATAELADLGPRVRSGTTSEAALNAQIDPLLSLGSGSERVQDLIRGTLLLWHDHLDAAHSIAQEIEDADGSLLHAIMHRREPDCGNAKYWFRRVGKHATFPELAGRAAALLGSGHAALAGRLVRNGVWDPFAFVDACEEQARKGNTDAGRKILQEVQHSELTVFLEHLCSTLYG